MARHVLLNNVQHQNLRVVTRRSAQLGDDVGSVVIFPTEYREIQREYPIFFRKDPATGEFLSVALLGFNKDENLFLDERGWNARYIPAVIARGPFLIGFQEEQVDGEFRQTPVIHIDLDHRRVSQTDGEPLFLPLGGHSPYLQQIGAVLECIHRGLAATREMFAAFTELDLIEPLKLEVRLTPDEHHNLLGYYTINREKLQSLPSESVHGLHKAGFLESAFLVVTSLANFQRLVDLKLLRHRAATPA